MPKKKPLAKDKLLHELLDAGGRPGAGADFDTILTRAAQPAKPSKPKPKSS